jgi:hypothetical protein
MLKTIHFAVLTALATASVASPPAIAQSADPGVSVPREVLERYVGRYELNGTIVTVGLTEDGRLTAQLAGQPPAPPLNWEARGVEPDVAVPAGVALAAVLQRLGQPAVSDIAVASQRQVFAPRTAPLPGSEAALRSIVTGVMKEPPDLTAMSPQQAEMLRPQLPALREQLGPRGEIRSVRFLAPGLPAGDAFEVVFAHGALGINIILGPGGLVEGFSMRPGAPGS